MDSLPSKSISCSVVSGPVTITLRRHKSAGGRGGLFVRCSEKDRLYIDANQPPCPLTVSLFNGGISARSAKKT